MHVASLHALQNPTPTEQSNPLKAKILITPGRSNIQYPGPDPYSSRLTPTLTHFTQSCVPSVAVRPCRTQRTCDHKSSLAGLGAVPFKPGPGVPHGFFRSIFEAVASIRHYYIHAVVDLNTPTVVRSAHWQTWHTTSYSETIFCQNPDMWIKYYESTTKLFFLTE